MKISKERLDKLKKRGRSAGRAVAAGGKSTLYEGAAGVAAAYAEGLLKQNFKMVQERPWAGGAALVAAGHLLKRSRKLGTVGAALCGAGGYSLGIYLRNRKASSATATTAAPAAAPVAPSQTQGVYDYPDNDIGMVVRSGAMAA
jgi:hypothetical protein